MSIYENPSYMLGFSFEISVYICVHIWKVNVRG